MWAVHGGIAELCYSCAINAESRYCYCCCSLLDVRRTEVSGALEELRTITTYDDNLEKQYKESQCTLPTHKLTTLCACMRETCNNMTLQCC